MSRPSFTHEVQITPSVGRTRWRPCTVVGYRERTRYPGEAQRAPGIDVVTADGKLWTMCHADCVRVKR